MRAPDGSPAKDPSERSFLRARRSFLRVGLWGAALLGVGALVGRSVSGYVLPLGVAPPRALSTKALLVLAAVVQRIAATDGVDAPQPDGLAIASWLDGYLGGMDAPVRRDVSALLNLVEHGSALFRLGATRYTHMSPAEQDRTLAEWSTSALAVRRQGFQGLRALAYLGYYRQDRTFAMLGYPGPMLPTRPT